MKRPRPLGVAAAMCALVASVVAVDAVWRPAEGSGISITADVDEAPNLFEGGRVMVRGVEVGRIVNVDPGPESVRLTMQIDEGVPIAADATLQVVPITVIADRYVQLTPYESGPRMESGEHIPIVRTQIPAELDEVLGELKDLIDAFGRRPGQEQGPLAKLVAAVDEALEGRGAQLSRTLESSASVLSNLAASQSDIQRLVQNVDHLFVSLANASSRFGLLNERFALVTTALRDDQDALEGTIENLQFLSQQAADVVLESGDDLGESFGRLDDVLGTILEHQNAVTRGARWTNAVAQALGATDARGRGRFAYTGKQGGDASPYNYRLDQRDTVACQRIGALTDFYKTLVPSLPREEFIEFTVDGVLTYLPEVYQDDVEWLIRVLIPPCGLDEDSSLNSKSMRTVKQLAAKLGTETLAHLASRWFATGFVEEPSP